MRKEKEQYLYASGERVDSIRAHKAVWTTDGSAQTARYKVKVRFSVEGHGVRPLSVDTLLNINT